MEGAERAPQALGRKITPRLMRPISGINACSETDAATGYVKRRGKICWQPVIMTMLGH